MYNNGMKQSGPTIITARHFQIVKDGIHTPTPSNILGLSRNQRVILNALQASDKKSTDTWISQSHTIMCHATAMATLSPVCSRLHLPRIIFYVVLRYYFSFEVIQNSGNKQRKGGRRPYVS